MMVRGANFPPNIAGNFSNTFGSFSFSRWNLGLVCFGLLIFRRRSSSANRGHFQCLLLESFVFWQCSLLVESASSSEYNQSDCGVAHLGHARSIFWMFCDDQSVLFHLCRYCWRVHKSLASFHTHPCPLLRSSLIAEQECPSLSD